jgi:hypothetical protein
VREEKLYILNWRGKSQEEVLGDVRVVGQEINEEKNGGS